MATTAISHGPRYFFNGLDPLQISTSIPKRFGRGPRCFATHLCFWTQQPSQYDQYNFGYFRTTLNMSQTIIDLYWPLNNIFFMIHDDQPDCQTNMFALTHLDPRVVLDFLGGKKTQTQIPVAWSSSCAIRILSPLSSFYHILQELYSAGGPGVYTAYSSGIYLQQIWTICVTYAPTIVFTYAQMSVTSDLVKIKAYGHIICP